ncbi:MAG: hypothetical protein PHD51_01480 [Patescibacteria group bacterium]|nr:hypothetical protein [Patescibacteria group bacterium]MDD5490467.1 hypothetical protein [Patescibacteria group bacterium]
MNKIDIKVKFFCVLRAFFVDHKMPLDKELEKEIVCDIPVEYYFWRNGESKKRLVCINALLHYYETKKPVCGGIEKFIKAAEEKKESIEKKLKTQ